MFLHLIPIYSALLTGVLLGEPLMGYHVVGFVLILAGVWCAAGVKSHEAVRERAAEAEFRRSDCSGCVIAKW